MRNLLLRLHRWAGLLLGAVVFVVAVTGSALVFEHDIDAALNRDVMRVGRRGERTVTLVAAVRAVAAAYPDDPPTSLRPLPIGIFPEGRSLEVGLRSGEIAYVDPYSGEVLGKRDTRQSFARFLHLLHTRLVAGEAGVKFVGAVTLVTLLMALSGLYLWWPRKVLALTATASWRRTNLDLHHVLGFYSSLLMVVMCATGVIIAFEELTEPLLKRLDGRPEPPPVESTPIAGGTPLSVDEAVRIAHAALPGARTAAINLPPPGKAVYRALMKFPEDRTPAGRSRVLVDQWSGAVLQVQSTREARLGTAISNLKRSAHTGDIWGWPTQALYFLASLAIAGQVVTGFLVWWRPGRLAARRRAAERVTGEAAGA